MSNVALVALLLVAAASTPSGTGCDVSAENGSPTVVDEARAHAACATARNSFAGLFGDPVPDVRVILWEESHYRLGLRRGEAVIFWPTSQAMTPRTDDLATIERHLADQWREVLPHEISHLLVAARFFPDPAQISAGGYGTPLPDWLDEALAIWAEPAESRARRVEQARTLPPELLDLRTILTSPHPATGRAAAYISRDGTAKPAEFTLWAFYPQSIAVLTFVHGRGGADAVRELVRRLREDPSDPMALAGLPGLPDDFDAVNEAWLEWIEEGEPNP